MKGRLESRESSPGACENSRKGRGLGISQLRAAGSAASDLAWKPVSACACAMRIFPSAAFSFQHGIPLREASSPTAAAYGDSRRPPNAARVDANYP